MHGFHVRFPATYPIVGDEAMPQIIEAVEEAAKCEGSRLHEMLAGVPHLMSVCEGEMWPLISYEVEKQCTEHALRGPV